MNTLLITLSVTIEMLKDEKGQDLIEYGLLVAFVAFAATVGMHSLASDMNNAFTAMGGDLTSALS
jgi:pilus assembly protein Flp/PilA